MNSILEEFLKRIPFWARILILLGGMFLSGFVVHAKVMSDLDHKITERLSSSPALIATISLKDGLENLQRIADERDRKTQARLDSIDSDVKEILKGQHTIIVQAGQIKAHAQTLKSVAQNIRYETKTIKQDTEFIKENAVLKKKK